MKVDDDYLKEYATKVIVPTKNGEFSVGSGLPISARFVLTAKHVLNEWNEAGAIEVAFVGLGRKDAQYKRYFAVKEPWIFDGSDIAFLELEEHLDLLRGIAKLAHDFSQIDGQRWDAAGFPEYSRDLDKMARDLWGDFGLKSVAEATLQVSSEPILNDIKKWKGASGAAVVNNGAIYGVLENCEECSDNLFGVSSLPWLFNNSVEFQSFYGSRLLKDVQSEEIKNLFVKNIERILQGNREFQSRLLEFSGWDDGRSCRKIAERLYSDWDTKNALFSLKRFLDKEKSRLKKQQFKNFVNIAAAIGKWYLLLSVNEDWVDSSGFRYSDNPLQQLTLEHDEYVEVVLSHSLKVCPEYRRTDDGILRPGTEGSYDCFAVYEACHNDATEESFLQDMYIDLRRVDRENIKGLSSEELSKRITDDIEYEYQLKNHEESAEVLPKLIYYMVSKPVYELIEQGLLLKKLRDKLQGRLQFICVLIDEDEKACKFNASFLLNALYKILILDKDEE